MMALPYSHSSQQVQEKYSMKTRYYIISAQDAMFLGVTEYRRGNAEKGYIVNGGDLATAPQQIKNNAQEVTEQEALIFIEQL